MPTFNQKLAIICTVIASALALLFILAITGIPNHVSVMTARANAGFVRSSGNYGQFYTTDTIDITTDVTGILPLEDGGTGRDSFPMANGIVMANSNGTALIQKTLAAGPGISLVIDDPTSIIISATNTSLTDDVDGVLAVPHGGTGLSSVGNNYVLAGTGTDVLSARSIVAGTGIAVTTNATAFTIYATGGTGNGVVDLTADVVNVLPNANGGTGYSSYSDLEILVGNSFLGNSLQKRTLMAGDGMSLVDDGASVVFSRTLVDLVSDVSGTLPTTLGGTGFSSYTADQFLAGASSGGGLVKKTIGAGNGITITSGASSLTITRNPVDLSTSDVNNTLPVTRGGTGATTFTSNAVLVGAGTGAVTAKSLTQGTGITITSGASSFTIARDAIALTSSDLTGTLPVPKGGTGAVTFTSDAVLVGAGTGAVSAKALTPGTGITITSGASSFTITRNPVDLSTSDVNNTLPVVRGGTGAATFTSNAVLVGAGTGPVTAKSLTPGNGITITSGASSFTITRNPVDLSTSDVNNTLPVIRGGTGATTFTSGALLMGTGTGAVTAKTLTAGTGISVSSDSSTITVATTGLEPTLKMWLFEERIVTGSVPTWTAGANVRILNTVGINGGSDVTLNTVTGVITFATTGNYYITGVFPAVATRSHRCYLYSNTVSGILYYGSTEYCYDAVDGNTVGTPSRLETKLVVSSAGYQVSVYTNAVLSGGSPGYASTLLTSSYNIFATLRITKLST